MPYIIAIAIRYVIMAAVQLGIWSLIEKYGLPMLNTAIEKTMEIFGVSEEDAQTFVANSLLHAFEEVGIFAITLRTKLPIIVAERLGFTTKGFNIRKLSPAGETKLPKVASVAKFTSVATTDEVVKVAEVIAKSKGSPFAVVSSVYKGIMTFVGVTALVAMTIGNFIDFANWQGAYQKTFEKLFTKLGFPPDQPMPKSKAVSADTWSKIYSIVEELNPESIAFPWSGEIKPYSRSNLADAVDHFAANLAVHGMDTTWKNVWGVLLPCIKLKQPAGTIASTAQVSGATYTAPQTPQVHVFSGVVSQGVIGSTATFTPRPDDLIENAEELTTASHNNLAPFLAALPSRMSYEIKVVPSVKSASGFTQRGTVQRVVSGYNKDGSAKYRTVVNKFAIMDIFVKTDKGTQSKITTIVLGPVDSVRFQGANVNLGAVAVGVQQNITAPASVTTPTQVPAPTTAKEKLLRYGVTLYKRGTQVLYYERGNTEFVAGLGEITDPTNIQSVLGLNMNEIAELPTGNQEDLLRLGFAGIATSKSNFSVAQLVQHLDQYVANEFPQTRPATGTTPTPEAPKTPTTATTLFEYYQAHGQALPSVEERSKLYEQLALGQAVYYTGTAEQNTKLLAALQGSRL